MTAPTNPLTRRQTVILRYLADGKTTQEIGQALFLDDRNVQRDIRNARRALIAETTTEAVVTALTRGLLKGTSR